MFGKLQYGKFAVPDNPVLNGMLGMGYIGDAIGQPVIASSLNAISMSPADAGGNSVAGSNGAAIQFGNPNAIDSDKYTPDYCNQIITGKISPGAADQFQCSLRGSVGVRPAFTTGNNVQPVSPSSLITPPATVAQIHQSMKTAAATPSEGGGQCPARVGQPVSSGGVAGVAEWINDNPMLAIGLVIGAAFLMRD